jgi:hypothetical protein
MTIYIILYIQKWMCVCLCVCSEHNSATPGAISTKLSTHDYIYKNIILYILYIYIYWLISQALPGYLFIPIL